MFYFRLAKELGMTVGMLLDNISGYELTEWIAFSKLENEQQEAPEEDNLKSMLKTMPDTVNQKTKFDLMMKEKRKWERKDKK